MKKKEVSEQAVFDQCLNYLSHKSRTEAEMVAYMEKKEYDERLIAKIMARLIEYHFVDDKAYLKNYCEANLRYRYFGRIRLRYDLKKRGINPTLLDELNCFFSEKQEKACCKHQFQKALRQYSRDIGHKKRQKIYAFLQRKGFPAGMINAVIETELPLEEATEEELEERKQQFYDQAVVYLKKYYRMYQNKGFTGYALKNRIIQAMMRRGYAYGVVKELLDEIDNDVLE